MPPQKAMIIMEVTACFPSSFEQTVMDAAYEATPFARGTFLWQYVYDAILGNHGRDQEVVIVTDGYDNDSQDGFRGTHGFTHMLNLLISRSIKLSASQCIASAMPIAPRVCIRSSRWPPVEVTSAALTMVPKRISRSTCSGRQGMGLGM